MAGCKIQRGEHRLLPLAHGEAADGVSVKADFGQLLGADPAQFLIQCALLDTKQGGPCRMFPARIKGITAALCPAHRHFHAGGDFITRPICARAFIKRHHNVRPQQSLDFHRAFGRQHVLRAVNVAAKFHTLFRQLAQVRQAHHLIAAAVGQYRAVPVHEFVQTAQLRHPFRAGAQHQVIGIAEDDVCTCRAHGFRLHRLYRCGRAHGHEGGRANITAHHFDPPGAGGAIGGADGERKPLRHGQNPYTMEARDVVSVFTFPGTGLLL